MRYVVDGECITVQCIGCLGDLSKRTDWEPFIQGIPRGLQTLFEKYRERKNGILQNLRAPKVEVEHIAICFYCLDLATTWISLGSETEE